MSKSKFTTIINKKDLPQTLPPTVQAVEGLSTELHNAMLKFHNENPDFDTNQHSFLMTIK